MYSWKKVFQHLTTWYKIIIIIICKNNNNTNDRLNQESTLTHDTIAHVFALGIDFLYVNRPSVGSSSLQFAPVRPSSFQLAPAQRDLPGSPRRIPILIGAAHRALSYAKSFGLSSFASIWLCIIHSICTVRVRENGRWENRAGPWPTICQRRSHVVHGGFLRLQLVLYYSTM